MPHILVVDDAASDRELAEHLLGQHEKWSVEFAENGAIALAKMQAQAPDVVVTDLTMPELDGLSLLARTRTEFPLVPVIVMTAKGSEEIAMQALEQGAASYVPKRTLARDLVDAVDRILEAAKEHKDYKRLLGRLRAASFELENDLTLISSLVNYLGRTLRDSDMFDDADCHRISTAIDEALTNAYYHGNLEVRSEVRSSDPRAYRALAEARCVVLPYRDRRIRVQASSSRSEARFVIGDDGKGFDPTGLPDPTHTNNTDRPSGRGVFLMKTFMDDVSYNDLGNEVTLVRRRSVERQPLQATTT